MRRCKHRQFAEQNPSEVGQGHVVTFPHEARREAGQEWLAEFSLTALLLQDPLLGIDAAVLNLDTGQTKPGFDVQACVACSTEL